MKYSFVKIFCCSYLIKLLQRLIYIVNSIKPPYFTFRINPSKQTRRYKCCKSKVYSIRNQDQRRNQQEIPLILHPLLNRLFNIDQQSLKMYGDRSSKPPQQFNTPSKQMIASKKYPSVKTVSVFIQNIDAHLAQSYSKLKSSKQKNLSRQKITTQFGQAQKLSSAKKGINNISLKANPLDSSKKRQLSSSGKLRTKEDYNQFVLMDNKQVMDYVNYVYETYRIPDPLQKYSKCFTANKDNISYETNKKQITQNDQYRKQLYSAQTMKNSIKHSSLQSSPFKTDNKRTDPLDDPYKRGTNVITLKSGGLSMRGHINPTFKIKSKVSKVQKQKHDGHSRHSSSISQYAAIPQVYRYCFMCELPILQCNLISHEQTCTQLKRAYQMSLNTIIELLDSKINRLIKEINDCFVQKRQSQISQQFSKIKESVRNWIQQLPPESITRFNESKTPRQDNSSSRYNPGWRSQFLKIEQNINQSVCRSFESINKLNWFAKLRENIAKQFYNQF